MSKFYFFLLLDKENETYFPKIDEISEINAEVVATLLLLNDTFSTGLPSIITAFKTPSILAT